MARRLVWSPEAVEDLESIASYISRDSVHYARAVVSRIVATTESIPENPNLGREVPELQEAAEMVLSTVFERFGDLLHTRLENDAPTTEDSVRYTFFAALLESGSIECHDVVLECPHPYIPRAEVDTWIPTFNGGGLAIEFKYDRDIPSGRNTPRTQRAGKVFHDLYRLGRIGSPVRRVFVYLTGPEMAGYFGTPANGLAGFFLLPSGHSLPIDSAFLSGKSATFMASVGEIPNVIVTALYARSLPRLHYVRGYEVTVTDVDRVYRRHLLSS